MGVNRTHIRRRAAAVATAVLLAVGLADCGSGTDRRAISASYVGAGAGFYPDTVTVDKEDTVRLRVGNGTDRAHGFSIVGYKIRRTVEPNQSMRVNFKASRAGTFRIYCQLHPTHQTATLIVR
jgi:plastocyanin